MPDFSVLYTTTTATLLFYSVMSDSPRFPTGISGYIDASRPACIRSSIKTSNRLRDRVILRILLTCSIDSRLYAVVTLRLLVRCVYPGYSVRGCVDGRRAFRAVDDVDSLSETRAARCRSLRVTRWPIAFCLRSPFISSRQQMVPVTRLRRPFALFDRLNVLKCVTNFKAAVIKSVSFLVFFELLRRYARINDNH